MRSAHPLSSRILLASIIALSAFGVAPALAKSTKPMDNMGDIKGESTQKDHKDWIQPDSSRCDTHRAQPMSGIASDPEEGGQVTASKTKVADIKVTKPVDTASTKMMMSSPSGDSSCGSGRH